MAPAPAPVPLKPKPGQQHHHQAPHPNPVQPTADDPTGSMTLPRAPIAPVDCVEPRGLPLTWDTGNGLVTTYATQKPLGLTWHKDEVPIKISSEDPNGHGKHIGIELGWVLVGVNHVNISRWPFPTLDHMLESEVTKLPPGIAFAESYVGPGGAYVNPTDSMASLSSWRAEKPPPAPAEGVPLTWETASGLQTVMATRKPLGLSFFADEVPVVIAEQSEGHGKDIGIQIGWKLKSINNVDVTQMTFPELDHLFHFEIGKLPGN